MPEGNEIGFEKTDAVEACALSSLFSEISAVMRYVKNGVARPLAAGASNCVKALALSLATDVMTPDQVCLGDKPDAQE